MLSHILMAYVLGTGSIATMDFKPVELNSESIKAYRTINECLKVKASLSQLNIKLTCERIAISRQ